MSKPINDGGPAFPESENGYSGMSLRDWFAGMALQGWLANPERLKNMEKSDVPSNVAAKLSVQWAFRLADAMIEARDQKPEDK